MIGRYKGSSGAERALRQVVGAMVMPPGVDAELHWPVFGAADRSRPLMAYQRRDTEYETGQTNRLLDVDAIIFDIYIWSSNENQVLRIMDALEGGFNAFPLPAALMVTRAHLNELSQDGGGAPSERATDIIEEVSMMLKTGTVSEQEQALAAVNKLLSDLSDMAGNADWGSVLAVLHAVQGRLRTVPPYSFDPIGCRDLTAPEVWQLGLAGRVFSVAVEYTAT